MYNLEDEPFLSNQLFVFLTDQCTDYFDIPKLLFW